MDEARRDPRLVDEHRDRVGLRGEVGEHPLDHDHARESVRPAHLGAKHLAHATGADSLQEMEPAELVVRCLAHRDPGAS